MQRKKEKYYTTGAFAKLFGIKKDTLFYYDRIGLFCPQGVGENRYRYYSEAQILPFSTLLALREMGVPVRELHRYFGDPAPERLLLLADEKIQRLDAEIRRLEEIRRLFSGIAANTREAEEAVFGRIQIREYPGRWLRYSEKLALDAETATGQQWGDAYDRFARQTGGMKAVSFGCVLARKDLEAGEYTKVDRLFTPCGPGEGELRPGGKYAVLYFRGPYGKLQEGYEKLAEEVKRRNLAFAGDACEEYLVAELATKREEEYVTKISVPVK